VRDYRYAEHKNRLKGAHCHRKSKYVSLSFMLYIEISATISLKKNYYSNMEFLNNWGNFGWFLIEGSRLIKTALVFQLAILI
jgi:hypothetical protein